MHPKISVCIHPSRSTPILRGTERLGLHRVHAPDHPVPAGPMEPGPPEAEADPTRASKNGGKITWKIGGSINGGIPRWLLYNEKT